eukprot:1151376-Pelagomonas_calceolata.AAC.2
MDIASIAIAWWRAHHAMHCSSPQCLSSSPPLHPEPLPAWPKASIGWQTTHQILPWTPARHEGG